MRRFGDNFFIRSDYQEKSDDKYDCLKNCLFLMKQAMFLAGKDFGFSPTIVSFMIFSMRLCKFACGKTETKIPLASNHGKSHIETDRRRRKA